MSINEINAGPNYSDLSSDDESITELSLHQPEEYVEGQYGLGAVLLTRMGHVKGEGLGARQQGIVAPVEPVKRSKNTGLGRIPDDEFSPGPPKHLAESEDAQIVRITEELANRRKLRQVALDAKAALTSVGMESMVFFERFREWWTLKELGSLLEGAAAALLAREIEVAADPLGAVILSNMSSALRLSVLNDQLWASIVFLKWLPAAVSLLGWSDAVKISKARGFLTNDRFKQLLADSIPIAKRDGELVGESMECLAGDARHTLVLRVREWLQAQLRDKSLQESLEFIPFAEEVAVSTDLDSCLKQAVTKWSSQIDVISTDEIRRVAKWCGAMSPNTLAQILVANVFTRWAARVPDALASLGTQWWYSWKDSLPSELQTHPDILDWIHYAIGLVNAHLDGVDPQFGPPRKKSVSGNLGTKSTFKDVVNHYCTEHGIPFSPIPLSVRGTSAKIVDDVLYLDTKEGWLPVSLDDLE